MKNFLKNLFRPLFFLKPLFDLIRLPFFVWQLILYRCMSTGWKVDLVDIYPCLSDSIESTPFDPHYFYQAAWLSRELNSRPPSTHVDIGSDVKLIGIISGFFETVFLDYRPLSVQIPGLSCVSGDILSLPFTCSSISSLSCLHVVEHVGLGRYGDSIDPSGCRKALLELQRVMQSGGILYLSVPIGRKRVCFNAHRVFDSQYILSSLPCMKLLSFSVVSDRGQFSYNCSQSDAIDLYYGCGMFVLEKI